VRYPCSARTLPTLRFEAALPRQALALLAEWRETKRGLPEPLHALSILLRKLGRTNEALTASRMLFELRPDWRSAGKQLDTLLSDVEAPSPVTAPESPPAKAGSWRVAALAWAVDLNGVLLLPHIWPSSWGEWALPSMASVGVALWIWARQARPRQRA